MNIIYHSIYLLYVTKKFTDSRHTLEVTIHKKRSEIFQFIKKERKFTTYSKPLGGWTTAAFVVSQGILVGEW